jgi:hypothetical protein
MSDHQIAADDVGVIAETVESLHKLLDKFYAEHGNEMYERLHAVWPDASRVAGPSALYKLSRDLTPPDSQ